MINQKGIDLIKKFEGCKLTAYRCPAGVLTIGYGSTFGVYEGQKISQEAADTRLINDIAKFEKCVKEMCPPMNENMRAALVSFAFNLGCGALKTSTLLKKLNAGDIQGAADQFLRWTKAGGVELKGLVERRKAERELFLAND
jgi:GH24 family phage-related lysozyme (muramidase)